jgi:hypothetical protein
VAFIDRISRRSCGQECVKLEDIEVRSLLFADDTLLVASTEADHQCALDRFENECQAAGMGFSCAKTEVMLLSRRVGWGTLHVSGISLNRVKFK